MNRYLRVMAHRPNILSAVTWRLLPALTASILMAGCPRATTLPDVPPLPVQQQAAYQETVTGRFVSLADFEEPAADGTIAEAMAPWRIVPANGPGNLRYAVNVTRTGIGSLDVRLPADAALVCDIPHFHDFTGYTLLTFAMHADAFRDDLRVTLRTAQSSWRSPRQLIEPGWNTISIDIRRLAALEDFDITSVEQLDISFIESGSDVMFYVDDVMLIDNRRTIQPAPPHVDITKTALDYEVSLPGRSNVLDLAQAEDGLWRFAAAQAVVQLTSPGQDDPLLDDTERIGPMGRRRIGRVEMIEHNPIRVRLINSWYFPDRAGEWASLAVRRIVWQHTFYGDGRWIRSIEYNNAGGPAIDLMAIRWAQPVVFADDGRIADVRQLNRPSDAERLDCLAVGPEVSDRQRLMRAYAEPGNVTALLAGDGFAGGDRNRDRFDESQGCYYLEALDGHCRFRLAPVGGPLPGPVVRIVGNWSRTPHVSSEGLAIRNVVQLDDGSILFKLPRVESAVLVEVTGPTK